MRLIFVTVAGGALILVGIVSPGALRTAAVHLPIAAAILCAAAGLGLGLFDLLGPAGVERRQRLICGTGLGIGALSLLVLGLGVCGVLSSGVWIGILGAFAAVGVWRCRSRGSHEGHLSSAVIPERGPLAEEQSHGLKAVARHGAQPPLAVQSRGRHAEWSWLILLPFAAMALLAATFPPGAIWPAEGNGYDVLEYHFGAPRDYLDAGRVTYLPHNIYANFPAAVEMLYLLSMIVHGDAVAAAPTAQMVNLLLAVLAGCGVWLAVRHRGAWSAASAAIAFATCPFVSYLCGVAYVENGLLLFTALALACVVFAQENGGGAGRWSFLAGLFAGMACSCKYSGVAAVFTPLLAATLWHNLRRRPRRVPPVLLYCAGALITFGPWLVKNAAYTGNPIFPMGYSVLGASDGVWDEDCASRWREGHLPAPEDRFVGARVRRLLDEVLTAPLFGVIFIAAAIAWLAARLQTVRKGIVEVDAYGRSDGEEHGGRATGIACGLTIVVTLVAWMVFSHLVGRFAVTTIVPAAVLLGASWPAVTTMRRRLGPLALAAIVMVNLALLLDQGVKAQLFELARIRQGSDTAWFTGGQWPTHEHVPVLNELAARGGGVLMVADARRFYMNRGVEYSVVFNRFPFAEAARSLPHDELLVWLRRRGTEYVFVNWSEMMRLRGSRYGFWQGVDESLFAALEQSGLQRDRDFHYDVGAGPRRYATLYRVP